MSQHIKTKITPTQNNNKKNFAQQRKTFNNQEYNHNDKVKSTHELTSNRN